MDKDKTSSCFVVISCLQCNAWWQCQTAESVLLRNASQSCWRVSCTRRCAVVPHRFLFLLRNSTNIWSSFLSLQLHTCSSHEWTVQMFPLLTRADVFLCCVNHRGGHLKRDLRFSRWRSYSEICLCVRLVQIPCCFATYADVSGCFLAICGRRKWKKNILKNLLKRQFMKKNKKTEGNSDTATSVRNKVFGWSSFFQALFVVYPASCLITALTCDGLFASVFFLHTPSPCVPSPPSCSTLQQV